MAKHPSVEDTTLTKAARLAVLLLLDEDGLLKGHTLQAIADALGGRLTRSTILKDLRLMARVKRKYYVATRRLDRDKIKQREK